MHWRQLNFNDGLINCCALLFTNSKGEFSPNQGPVNNGGGFGTLTSGYQPFKQQQQGGFNGFNSGTYASGTKPIFESVNNYEGGSGPGSSGFGTSGFGNVNSINSGSFHSQNPDYYKKALKGSSGINSLNGVSSLSGVNSLSGGNSYGGAQNSYGGPANSYGGAPYGGIYSSGANQYQESARQDSFDCVCVPFGQCPAQDVLGRKGDLVLPLDPRNLGSDIEAYSDESKATTNSTHTRVTKEASEKSGEDDKSSSVEIETAHEDVKKVSKREIAETKSDDIKKADGEAVSIQFLAFLWYAVHFIFIFA